MFEEAERRQVEVRKQVRGFEKVHEAFQRAVVRRLTRDRRAEVARPFEGPRYGPPSIDPKTGEPREEVEDPGDDGTGVDAPAWLDAPVLLFPGMIQATNALEALCTELIPNGEAIQAALPAEARRDLETFLLASPQDASVSLAALAEETRAATAKTGDRRSIDSLIAKQRATLREIVDRQLQALRGCLALVKARPPLPVVPDDPKESARTLADLRSVLKEQIETLARSAR